MAPPLRRSGGWLLLAASALSLVVAWVLASPIGASPDEPAHIWYAWGTATGQTLGGEHLDSQTFPGQQATRVQVPQKLLQHPPPQCYIMRQTPVRQCLPLPADSSKATTQVSYMSRYPPLFYGLEGAMMQAEVAADLGGSETLYGARLAAAAMSLGAVAFGVVLLSRRFPPHVVLLATLLGLPATSWFIAASVNPNGLEIAAAFLLAAAVLSIRVDLGLGGRSVAAVLAVPVGTLLLAWTRPLSWVWAALILGLLLVPVGQQDGSSWTQRLPLRRLGKTATTATVLVLASAMVWFGYALQIRSLQQAGNFDLKTWTGLNPVGRVIFLVLGTGGILSDQIGNFGWQDTPLPTVAIFAWVSIAGVSAAAWRMGRTTLVPRWAMGLVLGLGLLAAMLDEYRGGWVWQGRYLLPITAALCVLAVPGLVIGLERWAGARRLVPGMLVALMGVNALSVVWFLFRNAYGFTSFPSRRLPAVPLPVGVPSWTPPLGLGPVIALVAVAFACGVAAVWKLRLAPEDAQDNELVLSAIQVRTDAPLRSLP